MKKIKDFFYDKNDIIIVLLIVAIAAFVIYTSINSILGYPEQYANEMATSTTQEIEETTLDAHPSTEDAPKSTDETTKSNNSSDEEN